MTVKVKFSLRTRIGIAMKRFFSYLFHKKNCCTCDTSIVGYECEYCYGHKKWILKENKLWRKVK